MREIIFKAKRKNWKKLPKEKWWIEGAVLQSDNRAYIATSFVSGAEDEPLMVAAYEVIPETICQYTGLTDKDGQKIWENDIVDTFEESSKEILRNVVKFEDGCFKVFKEHYLSMHLDSYEKTDLKVVGNIFDSPELLEV